MVSLLYRHKEMRRKKVTKKAPRVTGSVMGVMRRVASTHIRDMDIALLFFVLEATCGFAIYVYTNSFWAIYTPLILFAFNFSCNVLSMDALCYIMLWNCHFVFKIVIVVSYTTSKFASSLNALI